MTPRVLIVGGGPAGLTAAISAARAGARVAVADRMDRVGKKLLASGNGRCNLSNILINESNYHGAGAKPAFSIIEKYGAGFAPDFFAGVGVLTALEAESRYYPATFSSNTVLNALRVEASRLGVMELPSREAVAVEYKDGVFTTAFRNKPAYISDRVIIAAGGMASPFLGSDGSGYALMTALGHRLINPAPALAPLRLKTSGIRGLKGARVRAGLTLLPESRGPSRPEGGAQFRETGELLFSDTGISGIPALNLSCAIAAGISETDAFGNVPGARGGAVKTPPYIGCEERVISLDLFPDMPIRELAGFLEYQKKNRPGISAADILGGIARKQIAALLLEYVSGTWAGSVKKINRPGENAGVPESDIRLLAGALKDWRHTLTGVMGFDGAQATYGGLSFDDFNPDTLESKIIKGLYAAGEILDVAGDCGGYNLHWAWVSGHLAGGFAGCSS